MTLNQTYQGILSSMVKDGRGFTSTSGTKYTNYKVMFENHPTSYQMAIENTRSIEVGDEISFELKLDKKSKLRLYNVKLVRYDIKYPLRKEPSDLIM